MIQFAKKVRAILEKAGTVDAEAGDDLVDVAAAGDLGLGLGPLLEADALDRL